MNAPWTYVLEPDAEHYASSADFQLSLELQALWIEATLARRIEDGRLVRLRPDEGLLGNHATGGIAPNTMSDPDARTSWLPDQAFASQWQRRAIRFATPVHK